MPTSPNRISHKAASFTESVIREMTRLAIRHQAINLAQGFPDFPAPSAIKDAACRAIQEDVNQYAITWGSTELREAVASKYESLYGFRVDPDREITVACGATECMVASILALVNPGEQVLVFEPFYENYGPDAIIAGAQPVYFSLDSNRDWSIDFRQLESTIRDAEQKGGIRALILNTPNNPSGKVFSKLELSKIAELANQFDFYVLTDEIYEHIIYDGKSHRPIALLPGMKERMVTISGLSKTFSVTGWRVGYIIAPADLTGAVRKMHDFLTVGAAAPLQAAGAQALSMDPDYYERLAADYKERRDYFIQILDKVGFKVWKPSGAYYIMVDISNVTTLDDVHFIQQLVEEYGVAAVPGSSFYHRPELGSHLIRFAFCKTMEVLQEAGQRLLRLRTVA